MSTLNQAQTSAEAAEAQRRFSEDEDSVMSAIIMDPTGGLISRCPGWGQAGVFHNGNYNQWFTALEHFNNNNGGINAESIDKALKYADISPIELEKRKKFHIVSDRNLFDETTKVVFKRCIARKRAGVTDAIANETEPDKISSLAQELVQLARAAKGGMAAWNDRFSDRLFDATRIVEKPLPIIQFGDIDIITRGNLSVMTAKPKDGKSATSGAMLAAIIQCIDSIADTFGIKASNPENHAVLHLDTEQSIYDHHNGMMNVLKRTGTTTPPAWLSSYNMLGVSVAEIWQHMEDRLAKLKAKHGGILLIIIDGIGDLVLDINDGPECSLAVTRLQALAVRYNCAILNVLHLNPAPRGGTPKSRGHLGSILERKAEVDIRIVKDKDEVSTVFTSFSRRAPVTIENGLRFKWSTAHGMHMSVSVKTPKPVDYKIDANIEICEQVFQEKKSLTYTDTINAIATKTGRAAKTAERMFSEFKKAGIIEKKDGKWMIAQEENTATAPTTAAAPAPTAVASMQELPPPASI